MNLHEFQTAVATLPFGKTLPTARYLYAPDESALPEPVASFVAKIRQRLALAASFNVIKLSPPDYAISFLRFYNLENAINHTFLTCDRVMNGLAPILKRPG